MNRLGALLVDFDGTLADTSAANFEAYRVALRERGFEVSRKQFDEAASGRHRSQFLRELAPTLDEAEVKAVASRKALVYEQLIPSIPINGALVQLIATRPGDCRTALVTTASARTVCAVLDYHDLGRMFDIVVTGDDVARHKPDPDCYELAARLLNVPAADCLVIEDSEIGIASARAFGAQILRVSIPLQTLPLVPGAEPR